MADVILISLLAFLGMHWALWRWLEKDYVLAFRMSRGVAALVLTALGFAGLVDAWPQRHLGFLYEHGPDDWMIVGVSIAYGHLLADMVSMAYGRWGLGIAPRMDLVAHHLLGLLAYGISMALGIGHALVLVSLASELMPTCTGLEAWGRHLGRPSWERAGAGLRLWILLGWRLPLWLFTVAMLVRTVVSDELAAGMGTIVTFVLACLVTLIGLDVYWVRKCAAAARRQGPLTCG